MANPDHVAILKQGVQAWNEWRKEHPHVTPDLSEANIDRAELADVNFTQVNLIKAALRGANLVGANLSLAVMPNAILPGANLQRSQLGGATLWDADLAGACLRKAFLDFANLSGAILSRADLSSAFMTGVVFAGANLSNANLTGTFLRQADFNSALLDGANCAGANADATLFANLDLSRVQGLETVSHSGPSTIGLDTLVRSQGRLPLTFLRGCGVPDSLIDYAASIVGRPFDFYSCFISYSTKDGEFTKRLHDDLQAEGVRCWLDKESLKTGEKFRRAIDEAIWLYDKFLLVMSEHSVQSVWVEKEVETAMEREREQNRLMLFPIRLDAAVMGIKTGWPADIRRTRHIGDFTNWKNHDVYQKAFERLLRDLKAAIKA